MNQTKRLYKSQTNKVLAGVCGGIGEYFEMDPVVIRLLYLVIMVFTAVAPGVVVYLIAMFVIPKGPAMMPSKVVEAHEVPSEKVETEPVASAPVNDTPAV